MEEEGSGGGGSGGERGELSAPLGGTVRPGIKVRLSGLGISLPIGNNEICCGRKRP